jgi:hypothetical protein
MKGRCHQPSWQKVLLLVDVSTGCVTDAPNDRRRRDVIALESGSPAAASRSAQMPGSSSSLQSHGDGSGCAKTKPVATIDGIAARQDGRVSNRCSGSRTDATRPRSGQPACIIVWLPVRVLPAPPRSPGQFRFPGAVGIVFDFPRLCRRRTRDRAVSTARNRQVSPKKPAQSLASPNLVWGLHCQAILKTAIFLAFLIGFFVQPGIPFLLSC